MDWANSNANNYVSLATRHLAGDSRNDQDGVAIEDMMATANQLNASPWFVMPWNADDAYYANFANYVAQTLPADKSVYVEVGNEVWNTSFAVAQQAQNEGLAEGLSTNARQAGLLRYAEKTVHVMQIWEAAFAGRQGLVRVVSSQHVLPKNADTLFTAPNLSAHTDAYATAPYFGSTMGGTQTRDGVISALTTALQSTESYTLQDKAAATKYGKRYIAYEGGQGLALPVNIPLLIDVENSQEMYGFYSSWMQWWKTNIGDTLCLYASSGYAVSGGQWGISQFETDTPAQSAKLTAVLENR
jgi:hypothetical protein